MDTELEKSKKKKKKGSKEDSAGKVKEIRLHIPVQEYRDIPIPGVTGARMGMCYVKVLDIPSDLDSYMEVNPRVPNRDKKGLLSGPVIKGIMSTLRDNPQEMVLKNQGIYLLVEKAAFQKTKGGQGVLELDFTDPSKHGIINGGHTYAAIRDAVENSDELEMRGLTNAYVRLHIFERIDEDYVPEIAEGLNRSKQVDDPSLVNLQGQFDIVRKAMKGHKGEDSISYHQGDKGDVYISEILVLLQLFNQERYNDRKHPYNLYSRQAVGLRLFSEDMEHSKVYLSMLIKKLPEILWLSDSIRKLTPTAARNSSNFRFGQAKLASNKKAGSSEFKSSYLPFIGEFTNYRVPNGWVYPMLAAFRANLKRSADGKDLEWKVPLATILPDVIDDMVAVCVSEYRANNNRPEFIGKKEPSYNQCYTKVQLYLAKKSLL